MRKFYIFYCFAFVLTLINNFVNAQCSSPCPPLFTISDSAGCNNVEIRRNLAGPGYTNTPFEIRACKNTRMKYSLSVDPGCYAGTIYSMVNLTGGTLISFTGNMFVIQWGAAATGNAQIAFETPGGGAGLPKCFDTLNLVFTLINKPVPSFTAAPQPACFNNPTIINFNSSASVNCTGFFWKFGDGFNSTLANPSHAYTLPGTYTVTLIATNTVTANGSSVCPTCIDSVVKTIVINNLPGPDITCVATVCAGDTSTYCTSAALCSSYLWTVTGGTILSGQNTNCVTVKWGTGTPQGSINLVATGCTTTYCLQGTTVTVPIIPVTGTIIGATLVCNNTSQLYTLPSWPGTTYSWNLSSGGSIIPFNTNTNQININWNTIGIHTITCSYYDSSLKCGGNASLTVFVRPNLSISGPATICINQSSTLNAFNANNLNPIASNWSIAPAGATINSGNGTSSINVTWGTAGIFVVTANSVTANQVCSPASYTVTVLPAPILSAINGPDSVCPGKTYVYSVTSNTTGFYNWIINNAAGFSFLGVNNDSVQVTWAASGAYSLTVTQFSIPNNCPSNTLIKNVFKYPTPNITGPVSVCADNTVTYTITNILNGNFNWFVTPPSFGTIQSGQGTNSIQIKWHGNNSPGSSNTVYLHFGVCNSDSIAVTINEPPIPSITPSGSLCGPTGITLSTGATGTFAWTGPGGPVGGNTSSITNINIPGNYSVTITNFNGTGCTVIANYTIPDVGRPVAQISATNVLTYCLPNLPNMNLVAVNGPGYTFQWYNTAGIILGATNQTLAINTLTLAGTYTYYCVVTLGTCVVTSNTITIVISNCPPPTGCVAAINVTSITGCNPFTLTYAATAPAGATIVGTGNPTITHLEDGYVINGNTTRTYTSIGYKLVRICVDVTLPNLSICRVCKDTVVNVTVAAKFNYVNNCGVVGLFDASTVVSPAVINSYNWTVGYNPGNTPVPLIIASFNNNTIANPVLTFTQSGSYIVTQTIKSGSCTVVYKDTLNISVPDASFNVTNSCVGTTVNFNNLFPSPTNFWDFGDAATSYTSPTLHAYGSPGLYLITHIVTDANGCRDTVYNPIIIVPAPICTVTLSGPPVFCFKDSVILGSSCTGLTNFQWYNNGVAIPGKTTSTDTVKQTGNFSFIAFDINGCRVVSDTVPVTVFQGPNVNILNSGSRCSGGTFNVFVPNCAGCNYQWMVDGNPVGSNSSQFTAVVGTTPYTIGTHNIFIQVINGNGCTDTSSINVSFFGLPNLSVSVVGPPPFCSNNLYTLNAVTNAASPVWAWNLNNNPPVLSTTNSLMVSAAGNYSVMVTDGVTGCSIIKFQNILPSPELNLFPSGCDTLCDTAKVFLPLPSFNGNISGYTIDWYNNAPPYLIPLYSGISFPLNLLPTGNNNLSVIVTSPNGCRDTSTVYSVFVKNCSNTVPVRDIVLTVKQAGVFALLNWYTEQEIDNNYFIVEKSFNGLDFVFAGKVWSRGNSYNKQYYTTNDFLGDEYRLIYYRIKMVFNNGETVYSKIVKLAPGKNTEESIQVLPNLISDQTKVYLYCHTALQSVIRLYAVNGTSVYRQPVSLSKGWNQATCDLEKLPAGIYKLVVFTGTKQLTATVVKK